MNYFVVKLGYLKPCESLDGAWENGTHSRARGGCHVSTFSGRGVTDTIEAYEFLKYLMVLRFLNNPNRFILDLIFSEWFNV